MQDVEKLRVYQDAKTLTKEMYQLVRKSGILFKLQERIIGSMGSVAANLAEFSTMTNENQKKAKMITCIGECAETIFWFDIMGEDIFPDDKRPEIRERLEKLKASLISLYKALGGEREA
jgi:four helix bundle protein